MVINVSMSCGFRDWQFMYGAGSPPELVFTDLGTVTGGLGMNHTLASCPLLSLSLFDDLSCSMRPSITLLGTVLDGITAVMQEIIVFR